MNRATRDVPEIAVIDASYRRLFARLPGNCRLDVCVANTPHTGYLEQEREALWQQLRSCIAWHRRRDATLIVLGDANSAFVGDALPDAETANNTRWAKWRLS